MNNPPPGAPLHTQNYSFDYGPVHFTGLESYDNYDLWRSEIYGTESFPDAQMIWLGQDLAAASGSLSQVLFYHNDFQHELDLGALGVEMALWGHVHGDRGSELVKPYDLATNNVCDGERSYRLIRVHDGIVQPEATLSAGSDGGNLSVTFAPANAGLSSSVTAQVTNNQPQRFEHGSLRFVMPAAGGNYRATGGQIMQIDQSDLFDICYVSVDIAANGSQAVVVAPAGNDVPGPGPGLEFRLNQNQPNPFNPTTELSYYLPEGGSVRLAIYDLEGHEISVLVDRPLPAGDHVARWHGVDDGGRAVASGIYAARLTAAGRSTSRKITLAR